MDNRKKSVEEGKQKEEKLTPVQSIPQLEDVNSSLNHFLQKPEINGDSTYATLEKIQKDFREIIRISRKNLAMNLKAIMVKN